MDYWKYEIKTSGAEQTEIVIALLADAPFDTFEDTDGGFYAYMPDAEGAEALAESILEDLSESFDLSWGKEWVEGQNWNVIWESNFQPVMVEDWCAVRADFHAPVENVIHELVINPKMAFGTGHHETTWMCLKALRDLPVKGATLLDYGCGTGVLAILAARLGAAVIEAVDIEEESYRNTLENSARNGVAGVDALCGTLKDVKRDQFDGIMANINRHIILDSLPRLAEITVEGGWLLISGILSEDENIVCDAARQAGFTIDQIDRRGNWLCIKTTKQ